MPNVYSFSFPAVLVRTLLAVLLLALRLPAAAQAPAWQSARAVAVATAAATDNFSTVTATAVDGAGNVYVAGPFENSVVLGSTTLTSLGQQDVFVAKFNPASNQFVWAQRAGGTGYDVVEALAVSGSSVYVTGYFTSATAGFGATILTNGGSDDVFVAKLSDAGSTANFAWALRAGGTGLDRATAMTVSGGSVYVAGGVSSRTAGFGPLTLTTGGNYDVFVAKLTDAGPTGSFAWVQQAGGSDGDVAWALAVSGSSVYVAGNFLSLTAGFGATTLTNVGPAGTTDLFVAKLTDAGSTGSFSWVQRAGGTGYDVATALAFSGSSVYIAGGFDSPTAGFGTTTLTNAGTNDVFVAKLSDAGSTSSFTWVQQAGGTGYEYAEALAVSGSSVYVAGAFQSATLAFGPITLTNSGNDGLFVAKLTDAGSTSSFAWAQQADGTATALAVSSSSLYVAGDFQGPTAGFGPITITNPVPPGIIGFLASLTDPTLTPTTAGRTLPPAQLYPNPARHAATLRLPADTAPASLTLTDALGRAVRRYPAPASPEAMLDLRGLPAGLYLLRGAGPAQRLQVE